MERRLAKINKYPLTAKNFTYKPDKERLEAAPIASLSYEGSGAEGFAFAVQLYDEHLNLYAGNMAASFDYALLGDTVAKVADQITWLLQLMSNGQITIMSTVRRGLRGRPYSVELLLSEDPARLKPVVSLVNFAWRGKRPGLLSRRRVIVQANDALSGVAKVPASFFLYQRFPRGTVFAPVVPPIGRY